MMRQSLENSFENVGPVGGFVPSPAASQMSNMSNPNKLMRMLSGRDQGRRAKTLKVLVYARICCSVQFAFVCRNDCLKIYRLIRMNFIFSISCRCLLDKQVQEVCGHYSRTRLVALLFDISLLLLLFHCSFSGMMCIDGIDFKILGTCRPSA